MTDAENDERIRVIAKAWAEMCAVAETSVIVHSASKDSGGLIKAAERAGYDIVAYSNDEKTGFCRAELSKNDMGPQCTIYGALEMWKVDG